MAWTDLDIEMLKRLWGAGLTSGQIEVRFDGRYSRNAIVGKIHRMGLSTDQDVAKARRKAGGAIGPGSNYAAGSATMAARRRRAAAVMESAGKDSAWNDQRDELLRKLNGDGLSHTDIAAAINAATGTSFTRYAISGRLHRKGWASGRSQAESTRQWAAGRRLAERGTALFKQAALPVIEDDPAAIAAAKPLRDLEHRECRWPLGDPRSEQFGFCGRQQVPGLPYCGEHVHRAYQNPEVAIAKAAIREIKRAPARERETV